MDHDERVRTSVGLPPAEPPAAVSTSRTIVVGVVALLAPLAWGIVFDSAAGSDSIPGSAGLLLALVVYGGTAALLTRASRTRSLAFAALSVLLPVAWSVYFDAAPSGLMMIVLALCGGLLARWGLRARPPAGALAGVFALGLLAVPTLTYAFRVDPEEAVRIRDPHPVLARLDNPSGTASLILVGDTNAPEHLSLWRARRVAPGYWRAEGVHANDPYSFEQSFDGAGIGEMCGRDFGAWPADVVGMCRISALGVIAGPAPHEAVRAELVGRDGRVQHLALRRGRHRGYLARIPQTSGEHIITIRFFDVRDRLLDARVAAWDFGNMYDSFALLGYGCDFRALSERCRKLDPSFPAVSVSMLRPAEFSEHCGAKPPSGEQIAVVSVFVRLPHHPGDAFVAPYTNDRRIVSPYAQRFAVGFGNGGRGLDGPVLRLPATREPCFPGPGNRFDIR